MELQRPFAVDRIGAGSAEVDVRASGAECAALARRMDIPAVRELACAFRLRAIGGGTVLAEGDLRAVVVRICVLTLDEFETVTAERFRVRFVPAGLESDDDDPCSDDEIAYSGAQIDLGEAAAEQLALALEPYPRKPDATLPEEFGQSPQSPFTALARPPGRR